VGQLSKTFSGVAGQAASASNSTRRKTAKLLANGAGRKPRAANASGNTHLKIALNDNEH
jgi:hypothetical protein